MTALHYRAKLRKREGETASYAFTPYDMMLGVELGSFRVELNDWTFEVTREPRYKGQPLKYTQKCIPVLIHKIKEAFAESQELPEEIWFIA